MKHLLFLLLIALATNAYGQCDQFDNLLKKGDAHLKSKKPNYQEAINAYTAAILACSNRASEAQKRIAGMVSDIDRLKENAVVAEKKATTAQIAAEAARLRSDSLYEVVDAERKRAEAVLDKIYFYDDQFGLASGWVSDTTTTFDQLTYEERVTVTSHYLKFGFIDKNLKVKIPFRFLEALPFDNTGYARVKGGNSRYYSIDTSGYKAKSNIDRYYLIDTTGAQYLLATEIGQLSPDITALDLRNKDIREIPEIVFTHTQLKILMLSGNQIHLLPNEIKNLTNLKALFIADNRLTSLPAGIAQLKNLHTLNVSYNKISSVPPELGQLKRLQLLDLQRNQLETVPPDLWQLSNLHTLDLSGNGLDSISAGIRQLTHLQYLDLYGNRLRYLPAEIGVLHKMELLSLSANRLRNIPVEIGQLKNLKSLYLGNNQFDHLPAEIGQLVGLKLIDLSSNNLSNLPPEIGQWKNLESIDFAANELNTLPAEIGQWKNLKSINLSSNKLKLLPSEIGQLKNLQTINLNGNELSNLPPEIGQLKNLESIDFAANELQSLPAEIGHWTNIKSINLSSNKLKNLPTQIGQLKNLESIDLSANNLTSLPIEIGQLKNLRSLNIAGRFTYDPETYEEMPVRGMESLPPTIGQLTNLRLLDLSYHQINVLPASMRQMTALEELDLNNNPFPPEYIEQLRMDMPQCKIKWVQSPVISIMQNAARGAETGALSAFNSGNYYLADSLTRERVAILRKLCARSPHTCKHELGRALFTLSWFSLFSKHPSDAVAAAQEGLRLGQSIGIRTNEGHGFLFSDQWEQASAVYLAIKNELAQALWEDFQDLAKAGIRHPDMVKAAELVLGRKLDKNERALITGKHE